MASIKPAGLLDRDEELRPVGIFSSIGHRQPSGSVVLQLEVLIGEFFPVDGFAPGAVSLGEVASLDHEIFNDTVEFASHIAFSLNY